jgi:hypothetical protein
LPRVDVGKVATAAEQERLLEPAFERAVARLDVSVLLLLPNRRRARRHTEVAHEGEVLGVEGPLFAGQSLALGLRDAMGGCRRVVGLVKHRHASELEERCLHAATHCHDRLAEADGGPLPIRIRQHDDAEHVREELPCDRDSELRGAREVRLRRLAGAVTLREEHLLVRTVCCPPALHVALQRAELPWRVDAGSTLRKPLEERLRFELRCLCEPPSTCRPVLG